MGKYIVSSSLVLPVEFLSLQEVMLVVKMVAVTKCMTQKKTICNKKKLVALKRRFHFWG